MKSQIGKTLKPYFLIVSLVAMLFLAGCTQEPPAPPASDVAGKAFNVGDYETAIAKYTEAITSEGDRYEFYFNRGTAYQKLGQRDNAIRDFQRAMAIKPKDTGRSAYALAELYLESRDYDQALAYAAKVLEQDARNAAAKDVQKRALSALVESGKVEKAYDAAQDMLDNDPYNPVALGVEGKALYEMDRFDEAAESLAKAREGVQRGSEDWLDYSRLLGLSTMRNQQFEKARAIYMNDYYKVKQQVGKPITDEDNYWAGAMADVNLDDADRVFYWSKLSIKFKKEKGIE